MKILKTQKGITLIALVITIAVMFILVAITISAVQNDGIVKYATNATNTHKFAEELEDDRIDDYEGVAGKYKDGIPATPDNSGTDKDDTTSTLDDEELKKLWRTRKMAAVRNRN